MNREDKGKGNIILFPDVMNKDFELTPRQVCPETGVDIALGPILISTLAASATIENSKRWSKTKRREVVERAAQYIEQFYHADGKRLRRWLSDCLEI